MAPPIKKTNRQKGGAIAEALPAVVVLLIFVAGILLSVYLMFARAWLQYQSEQALYCLAESKSQAYCRSALQKKLSVLLPWGQVDQLSMNSSARGWEVEVQWKIQDYALKVHKQLSMQRLVNKRVLRW